MTNIKKWHRGFRELAKQVLMEYYKFEKMNFKMKGFKIKEFQVYLNPVKMAENTKVKEGASIFSNEWTCIYQPRLRDPFYPTTYPNVHAVVMRRNVRIP